MKKPLDKRFMSGFAFVAFGTLFSQAISLLLSIFIAREIGVVKFGEYGIILSIIGVTGILGGMWLSIATTKFVSQYRSSEPLKVGNIIALSYIIAILSSIVVGLCIVLFANDIFDRLLNASHLSDYAVLISIILLLNAIDGVQVGILSGFEAFKEYSKTTAYKALISMPTTVILVLKFGLHGAIISLALNSVLMLVINYYYLKKIYKNNFVKISFSGMTQVRKEFLHFAIPSFFGSLLGAPVILIANGMLVNQPNGYAQMAILSAVNQWKNIILFIPRKFVSVALPIMSNSHGDSDNSSFVRVFNLTQSISILIIIPIVAFFGFFSDYILKFYGNDFSDGKFAFLGMLLVSGVASIGAGGGPAIQASGKMWFGLWTNIVWSFVFLLVVWLLMEDYGIFSIISGMLIAYIVSIALTYIKIIDTVSIRPIFNLFFGGILLSAITLINIVALSTSAKLFLQIVLLMFMYFLVSLEFKLIIDKKLKKFIKRN